MKNQIARLKIFHKDQFGRPVTVSTRLNINAINDMVLSDIRIRLEQILKALNIPYERVNYIVYADLDMKKISEKWTTKCLNADQKICKGGSFALDLCSIWVNYYEPETKQQFMGWRDSNSL